MCPCVCASVCAVVRTSVCASVCVCMSAWVCLHVRFLYFYVPICVCLHLMYLYVSICVGMYVCIVHGFVYCTVCKGLSSYLYVIYTFLCILCPYLSPCTAVNIRTMRASEPIPQNIPPTTSCRSSAVTVCLACEPVFTFTTML